MFSKWSVNSWRWNVSETLLRLLGFYSKAVQYLRIQTTELLDNRQKWQLNCKVFSWFHEVDLIPLYFAPQWLFRWALYNSSIMLIVVLVLPHTVTQSNGTSQPSFSFKNKLKIKSCLKQTKVLTSVLDKVATSSYLGILITNLCVFSKE